MNFLYARIVHEEILSAASFFYALKKKRGVAGCPRTGDRSKGLPGQPFGAQGGCPPS